MSEKAPGPSGFAAHVAAEKAVDEAVAMNESLAAMTAANEARSLTPEVQQLNDIAQVEIWGTRGRTAGFIDPATGNKLTHPIKGIVDEIRENRRYGTTESARETVAQDYEEQVQKLLDDGFELCQAKLIMDLRTEDEPASATMIAKQINGGIAPEKYETKGAYDGTVGMSAEEAQDKVLTMYAKKDASRIAKIKKYGIFTRDEYDASFGKGNGNSPNNEPPTKELKKDLLNQEQLDDLADARDAAREDYARRLAGRSSRHFLFGKSKQEFGEAAVAKARDQYEQARMRLTYEELRLLESKGVNPFASKEEADVMEMAYVTANLVDEYRLAREIMNQEKIASGSYRRKVVDGEPAVDEEFVSVIERVKSKNPLGRSIAAFKDFWERSVSDTPWGKTKRLGAALGLGILVGAPAIGESGTFLAPVLGASGAGLAANEAISRKLGHRRKGMTAAERRWSRLHDELMILASEGGGWYRATVIDKKGKPHPNTVIPAKPQQKIKLKERDLRMLRHGKIRRRADAPIDNLAKYAFERSNRDNRRNQKIMVGSVAVGAVAGKAVQKLR